MNPQDIKNQMASKMAPKNNGSLFPGGLNPAPVSTSSPIKSQMASKMLGGALTGGAMGAIGKGIGSLGNKIGGMFAPKIAQASQSNASNNFAPSPEAQANIGNPRYNQYGVPTYSAQNSTHSEWPPVSVFAKNGADYNQYISESKNGKYNLYPTSGVIPGESDAGGSPRFDPSKAPAYSFSPDQDPQSMDDDSKRVFQAFMADYNNRKGYEDVQGEPNTNTWEKYAPQAKNYSREIAKSIAQIIGQNGDDALEPYKKGAGNKRAYTQNGFYQMYKNDPEVKAIFDYYRQNKFNPNAHIFAPESPQF